MAMELCDVGKFFLKVVGRQNQSAISCLRQSPAYFFLVFRGEEIFIFEVNKFSTGFQCFDKYINSQPDWIINRTALPGVATGYDYRQRPRGSGFGDGD